MRSQLHRCTVRKLTLLDGTIKMSYCSISSGAAWGFGANDQPNTNTACKVLQAAQARLPNPRKNAKVLDPVISRILRPLLGFPFCQANRGPCKCSLTVFSSSLNPRRCEHIYINVCACDIERRSLTMPDWNPTPITPATDGDSHH